MRYLGFSSLEPALTMAIDEFLFSSAVENVGRASLRFFTFDRPCISIGNNQRTENLPAGFIRDNTEIVRRPTGGGAVFHGSDLCYSIVMPEAYLGKAGSLLESYRMITRGLKAGFEVCGIDVRYGNSTRDSGQPLCFYQALSYELTVDGKKLVGSAQRRAKGILLQQGSITRDLRVGQDSLIKALLEGLKSSLNIEYVHEPLTGDEIETSRAYVHRCSV